MSVVTHLALTDFRCYSSVDLILPPGVTVVSGANGQGKTSLLEALGWAATARSFRGVPDAALVRSVTDVAYLRDKLDRPFGKDTIETVRGAGYRLRVE